MPSRVSAGVSARPPKQHTGRMFFFQKKNQKTFDFDSVKLKRRPFSREQRLLCANA
jgi:hypothetical protein